MRALLGKREVEEELWKSELHQSPQTSLPPLCPNNIANVIVFNSFSIVSNSHLDFCLSLFFSSNCRPSAVIHHCFIRQSLLKQVYRCAIAATFTAALLIMDAAEDTM